VRSTSGVEDFQWMIRYLDALDETNAKILEALGVYGPRNTSLLAKQLKMSPTTVAFRISRLIKETNLQIRARLNFQKLGLHRAVVYTEAKPGKEKILRTLVENQPYWTYITRCFGKFNGTYALYSFPAQFMKQFEDYFKEMRKQQILDNYLIYWVTDFCEIPPNFNWFNFKKRRWDFQWQAWLKEIENAADNMPKQSSETETYSNLADKTDLLILKELEKDGTAEFKKLAEIVAMTPEAVRYRFQNHILERGLISDYEISIFPYPYQSSDLTSFAIDFTDQASLAKFANSLTNKPFILNYTKTTGQNRLIAHFFTPKMEFPNLIDSLNHLIEKHIAERFLHVVLDTSTYKRQTVSYEFYEKNKWTYNYQGILKNFKKALS